jgi:hypothetical protein
MLGSRRVGANQGRRWHRPPCAVTQRHPPVSGIPMQPHRSGRIGSCTNARFHPHHLRRRCGPGCGVDCPDARCGGRVALSAAADAGRDFAGALALGAALAVELARAAAGRAQVLAGSRGSRGCFVARLGGVCVAPRFLPLWEEPRGSAPAWPRYMRRLAGTAPFSQ